MTELQITAVTHLTGGKISFTFENEVELILYRSELHKLSRQEAELLFEGSSVPQQLYHKMLYEIVGLRAKKRAVFLLQQMDRTKKQLAEKLRQGGYPEICVEEAVAYVESCHYLDDERYARTYIRYKQEKKSRQRLRMDLMAKGVDRELIDAAFEEEYIADETDQIRQLLQKRHYDYQEQNQKERQKTYQFLMRRGFKSSDIMKVFRA